MEGVDHVHIVEVGGSCFIGDVYRMLQGQTPYGESLKLGITSLYTALILIVELTETYSHLARTWTWSCDDDELSRCLNVVVLTKAFVAGNEFHVMGITIDKVVYIRLDAHALQSMTELICCILTVIMSDDDRSYHKVAIHEFLAQTQHVFIIGNAQVCTYLIFLDVFGTYYDDDFQLVT